MSRPNRRVQIAAGPQSDWQDFLQEFFDDTAVSLTFSPDAVSASRDFDRQHPQIVFYEPEFLTLAMVQKWKAARAVDAALRMVQLGEGSRLEEFKPDASFCAGTSLGDFQRELVKILLLPESLHVLITDDEPEIGAMIRDFLSTVTHPRFQVDYVDNGAKTLEYLKKNEPDVLVLDVKMPVMTGIEVYRHLETAGRRFPVIVFFDAVFGDEIEKLHAIGRPAILEKGSRQSEMPALLSLIKKKAFFG